MTATAHLRKACVIDGCFRPQVGRGLCNMHWCRWRKGITDMRPELLVTRRSKSLDEAFERYVTPGAPDECWEWTGPRMPKGYGTYGRDRNKTLAHRAALRRSGVEVPPDMKVLHSCDNPPCCNPRHLRVGTQADNVRDMWARGRAHTRARPKRISPYQGEEQWTS